MTVPLIAVSDLRVSFDDGRRQVPVLHGVDLSLNRGETLGMVGESGCGKSVTWLAVLRLLGSRARITGSIRLEDTAIDALPAARMPAVRGRRIAMIFQDPAASLNPVLRIGRQLTEALGLHRGLRGRAAEAEAVRLLDRVRIPDARTRLRAYPHELSGGMNQRVMIAMALAGEPDLLIADEPTTALDVTIQAQILALLQEVQRETGMAMVLVSHDLGVVSQVCDRVMVMYAGRVVERSSSTALFDRARHPYAQGLIGAMPDPARPRARLAAIAGTVPAAGRMPPGCSFEPRCRQAQPRCRQGVPPLAPVAQPATPADTARHEVACFLATDTAVGGASDATQALAA